MAATHMMSSRSTGMRGTTSPCRSHSAANATDKGPETLRPAGPANKPPSHPQVPCAQRRTTRSGAYTGEHSLRRCTAIRSRSRFQNLSDSFCWRRGRRCRHAGATKSPESHGVAPACAPRWRSAKASQAATRSQATPHP